MTETGLGLNSRVIIGRADVIGFEWVIHLIMMGSASARNEAPGRLRLPFHTNQALLSNCHGRIWDTRSDSQGRTCHASFLKTNGRRIL
jgi:hypothetical protein